MRGRKKISWLWPCLTLVWPATASAQPTRSDGPLTTPDIEHHGVTPPGTLINVNLEGASLEEAVKMVSEWTGRRFVFGGKLRPVELTIVSPKPVTASEAYAAFLSALASHGLTVVPVGRYTKIVATQGVASELTPIYGSGEPVPEVERYVTRLYRLQHIDAAIAEQVLASFKSTDATITAYPGSKLLIVTDTGSNVRRLLRLVEELDRNQVGEKVYFQPLHHTPAEDVAQLLGDILRIDDGGARIVPDSRNNQLVIVTSEEDYGHVLELVRRIDRPSQQAGQFRAIHLQHARCDEIQPALDKVLSGPTTGEEVRLFEGPVAAHCVEASNALMVVSSLGDYGQLQHIVSELDAPRRQVFIEAVIMDVKVLDEQSVGIGAHGAGPVSTAAQDDTLIWGGFNAASSAGPPANLEALAFGVRGPAVAGLPSPLPGISIPAFGVALHALATDGDANLLATPHILATDNITSEIAIGENIALTTNAQPIPQIPIPGAPPIPAVSQQAPRRDVGIILSITPRINDAGEVRLEIEQEFSSALPDPQGTLGAINVAKRTANTTVVVEDQQTVVIGGLTREEHINAATKIPVLGDIPLLGALFSHTQKKKQKVNLLLVLTPHIIRDKDDLRRIFERKMQERQEFLDRHFVFDDSLPWEPPTDYRKTNGMVETIRQTQLALAESEARRAELAERRPREHSPSEALSLPSIASAGPPPPSGRQPTTHTPKPATPATRPRPKPRVSVPGGRSGVRYRVE